MIDGPFSNILCTHHNKPITRIKIQQGINSAERLLCSKCKGAGESIDLLTNILDQLQIVLQSNQLNYKSLQLKLQRLKLEIGNIINQVFSYMESAIQQSEFEITKIMRYIKYKDFCQEFQLEDLQKLVEFVFNMDIQKSVIYKTTQQLKEVQQKYRYQIIKLFDQLKDLIKVDLPIKQEKSNKPPLYNKQFEKQIFEKKKEYGIGLVKVAKLNQTGDLLIQGQYPFQQFKNLEIKIIDNSLEFQSQFVVDEGDDSVNLSVTALALNEKSNQLFVGYQNGIISTFQNSGNVWNKNDQQKFHEGEILFLIMDFFNKELLSVGGDNILKSYSCQQVLKVSNKIKYFTKEINDIQLNKDFKYLLVILENQLHIFNNHNEFSEFQQISFENQEQVTCLSQGNRQIYIGSNLGNIYIYSQKEIGCQYFKVNSLIFQSQPLIQIQYCEISKILLLQFEDGVILYQNVSGNTLERLQEIKGKFELSIIHKQPKIILFSETKSMAYVYLRKA
ncbi:unnamed protein product [Paramecium pentaurelia]|uniref:WD40-repeat-containing domain n=1 Tax=Paramecium pentaurelia TaxID=43138 RepID=A0A8S1VM92_9CILI|nr:unnamed protein product [Paramecium pentaurelia]